MKVGNRRIIKSLSVLIPKGDTFEDYFTWFTNSIPLRISFNPDSEKSSITWKFDGGAAPQLSLVVNGEVSGLPSSSMSESPIVEFKGKGLGFAFVTSRTDHVYSVQMQIMEEDL